MLKEKIKDHDDILEQQNKVVEDIITVRKITKDNAVFSRTQGGFVSLCYTGDDSEAKEYSQVAVHRYRIRPDTLHIDTRPDGDGRE